jgi:hypothetical protein
VSSTKPPTIAEETMRNQLVLGALLGGLVLFAWGFVSHGVLGWHEAQLRAFTNEPAVQETVVSGVSGSGLYLLPNLSPAQQGLPKEERAAAESALMERFSRGPTVFAVVRVGSQASMPVLLGGQLLLGILTALVATWLLAQAKIPTYGRRVAFVTALAVVLVLFAKLPHWLWWSFPTGFTLVESIDTVIAFALLGALLGRIVRPAGSVA